MPKGILIALAIVGSATLGYFAYFQWATAKSDRLVSDRVFDPGLSWVKSEFQLGETEFAALEKANSEYMPRCENMCQQLAEARRSLASLIDSPDTEVAAIESAFSEISEIERRCVEMTLGHIDEVSRMMDAEKGARYRTHMIKRLMGYRINHHHLYEDAPH